MQLAVPTPDHYLPLMYLLGLWEDDEEMTLFNDELVGGSISMTSLLVH
jgi:4,5-DOPA dioxygenase extradiol